MEKRYDVLVIGELNIDLILNDIESFPEMGKEKISRDMSLVMGSSSAIFACNIASLGNRIGFIGKIGNDDFGNIVLKNLEAKNVDSNFIIKSDTVNTGATIVLNYDQDRAMITYPGGMENLVIDDIPFSEFKNARHLHLSSFFLQTGIKKDVTQIFKRAKQEGMTTSMDIQWDPAEKWDFDYKETLPYIDVFFPNEAEIKALTGTKDAISGIHKLKQYGNIIAVKSGDKGSFLWKDNNLVHKKAFTNEKVVDAIGAGDSFDAGFIHNFLKGESATSCLDFANLTGAISTTAAGGTAAFESFDQVMQLARSRFNYDK